MLLRFSHVVAYINNLFLYIASSILSEFIKMFTHSPVGRFLGYFQSLVTMNKVAISIYVQVIFWKWISKCSSTIFLKWLSFFHWIILALFLKINWLYICGSMSRPVFSSTDICLPLHSVTLSWFLCLYSKSWSEASPPNLFFFKTVLAIILLAPFHKKFKITCQFCKKPPGILIEIAWIL